MRSHSLHLQPHDLHTTAGNPVLKKLRYLNKNMLYNQVNIKPSNSTPLRIQHATTESKKKKHQSTINNQQEERKTRNTDGTAMKCRGDIKYHKDTQETGTAPQMQRYCI